jgi:hypothetical protein
VDSWIEDSGGELGINKKESEDEILFLSRPPPAAAKRKKAFSSPRHPTTNGLLLAGCG